MAVCPKCQSLIVPSGSRRKGLWGQDTPEETKIITQCMTDMNGVEWGILMEKWTDYNRCRYKTVLPMTAKHFQLIAAFETEKGRIFRILGKDFPAIIFSLEICPVCKAILRPSYNPYRLIMSGLGLIFMCFFLHSLHPMSDYWFPLKIFLIFFCGFVMILYFLVPKKYEIVENTDQGLGDLKQRYDKSPFMIDFTSGYKDVA